MRGRVVFVLVTSIVTACLIKPDPPSGAPGDGGHDAADDAPSSTQNYIFVTRQTYPVTSILSSSSPALHADQLCMTAAQGHFDGTFVAWFSDFESNALQRIAGSRGWIRPDGLPFANEPDGAVFYPPRLDETGADLVNSGMLIVGTNTLANGSTATTCTGGSTMMMTGLLDAGAIAWTESGCRQLTDVRLYCLGVGHSNDVAPSVVALPSAFRGSLKMGGGNFSNLDAICTNDAQDSHYRALLSTMTVTAKDYVRGAHVGNASWVRKDGVVVSRDAITFDAPIELDVHGNRVADELTWGGADDPGATGGGSAANCGNWASSATAGKAGSPNRTHMPDGFGSATDACTTAHHVYCLLEQ